MGFLTAGIVETALEVGLIYSLVALSLFISFSILDICDLSTDGCYTLGCAVGAVVTLAGHPVLALVAAMLAGVCSGFVTAVLQTKFGVQSILAGIVVNTGLYTVNLAVMGFSSNLSIFGTDTVFSLIAKANASAFWQEWSGLMFLAVLIAAAGFLLKQFLATRLGLSIRATGDSPAMVRASSINTAFMVTVGLCVSNSLTGLAGALIGQYNKTCDINLGTGMVTIALASLLIGGTVMGRGGVFRRAVGVVLGSVIFRLVYTVALRLNMPAFMLKLVSSVIVILAISVPYLKTRLPMLRRRMAHAKGKGGEGAC